MPQCRCIPSKALLHAAKVIEDAEEMGSRGIAFGAPEINLEKLRGWKGSVVKRLTGGLRTLAKQRKVEVVQGVGRFVSANVLEVMGNSGSERIRFEQCIIAAGSEAVRLPGLPEDPRIMDSTDALQLPEFSGGLLVIGGGIIGLEMACVYDALGSRVSVVELTPHLMQGCDPDLVRPLERRIRSRYEQILLGTRVAGVEALAEGIRVTFEGEKAPAPQVFGRVLVAVGRSPNGKLIGAEAAGVNVSDRGFVPVDKQLRTNVPHIFAVGDIAGPPMLAHKAMHEAKVAAEVAAGHRRAFDVRAIPSVAYTDPEVAWAGLTETEAKAKGIAVEKGTFPWAASGRSLSLGRDEGMTKLLFEPETRRLLGAGIVGYQCGGADQRARAGDRERLRCGRHRTDGASAPNSVGDRGWCRRGRRGNPDRPLHPRAEVASCRAGWRLIRISAPGSSPGETRTGTDAGGRCSPWRSWSLVSELSPLCRRQARYSDGSAAPGQSLS